MASMRFSSRLARDYAPLLAAALLAIPCTDATASDFFGPSDGLQIQPELDVFERLSDDFRLIQRVLPTFIPSQGYSEMGLGTYVGWFVAPVTTRTISPDFARRRRLVVPGEVLFTVRNRVEARWQLAAPTSFA